MITAEIIPATLLKLVNQIGVLDFINSCFVFIVACLWLRSTAKAWQDEEIKGLHWTLVGFYMTWSTYCVAMFALTGSPLSAYLMGFLTFSQITYLFSYWIFVGNFNYEKRSHRARWWFLSRLKRTARFFGNAVVEIADLPSFPPYCPGECCDDPSTCKLRPECEKPPLPRRQCNVCGFESRHDLDGHCMICDTKNGG